MWEHVTDENVCQYFEADYQSMVRTGMRELCMIATHEHRDAGIRIDAYLWTRFAMIRVEASMHCRPVPEYWVTRKSGYDYMIREKARELYEAEVTDWENAIEERALFAMECEAVEVAAMKAGEGVAR